MMWITDRQLRENLGVESVYIFSSGGKCLSPDIDLVFILLALENMFGNVQVNISIDFIF